MVFYIYDPNIFKFNKPRNWPELPFYKKIAYYQTILNQNYSPYVDKLTAKQIVKELCGDKIKVAKIIRILKNPDDLHQIDLNTNHIIKSTHGSGWNINITKSTNLLEARNLLRSWNISYYSIHNEEQYKYIRPCFFIEEKIDDKFGEKNGEATRFSIRCLNGEPFIVTIKLNDKYNKYDINFNLIEAPQFALERPIELDRMMELSKILSKPFEFVRVDFYIAKNSDIYFSEFTFTPSAGNQFFTNEIEMNYGALWK